MPSLFVDGLATRGYYLARGDRRGHVVVDLGGDGNHSLYREVEGVKGKTIRERLAGQYDPDNLRDVQSVIEYVKEQREQRLKEKTAEPEKTVITPEQRRAEVEERSCRAARPGRKRTDLNARPP